MIHGGGSVEPWAESYRVPFRVSLAVLQGIEIEQSNDAKKTGAEGEREREDLINSAHPRIVLAVRIMGLGF